MDFVLAFLIGYVSGSIPFGLLLAKAAGLGDIRKVGSGNIGATNVLRTGNKWLAAGTLLLDFLKGLVPVLFVNGLGLMYVMGEEMPRVIFDQGAASSVHASLAALGAVMGHCFPVWLGFKGGKGVATNAGVSFGLAWSIGLAYALVWIAVLAIFRISSIAGMSAVVAAAIAAWLAGYPQFVPVLAIIAALIIWLHRANIGRLMRGEEPKVGSKK